jgi:CRISP-associated protein Cas1
MTQLADQPDPDWANRMMGLEGTLARRYWQTLSKALPDDFDFDKRSRRPAEDPFNAALNYAYGMLYGIVEGAVLSAGLDPQVGVLHADEYNKPVFAFDLIEPFRPWIDRVLLTTCLSGEWHNEFFEPVEGDAKGITLSRSGKAWLIPAVNAMLAERCRFQEKQLSHRNHIHRFAGDMAQWLLKQHFQTPLK